MAAKQVYEDQAAVEAPLLKDLLELGAEVTWSSPNTFSTQDNHVLVKLDLTSGGAGGQVEQASVEAPLLELGAEITWLSPNTVSTQSNHVLVKCEFTSEGAGGQVEQAVAKQTLDDQAAGGPLL